MNQETSPPLSDLAAPHGGAMARHDLIAELARRDLALATATRRQESLSTELDLLRRKLETRTEELVVLTRAIQTEKTRADRAKTRSDALRADLAARFMALSSANAKNQGLAEKLKALEAADEIRRDEMLALTARLEAYRPRLAKAEARILSLTADRSDRDMALSRMQAKLQTALAEAATLRRSADKATSRMRSAERQVRALMASTSWKITGPLRWVVLRLRPGR